MTAIEAPEAGTLQRWAWDYITTDDLAQKIAPAAAPLRVEEGAPARRLSAPGRPGALRVVPRAPRSPGPDALRDPKRRAQVLHTFWHHELQAAELMAWALLAFPDAPEPLRRGLVKVHEDEIRHMAMYRAHMNRLGLDVGAFPVRDWFWERVPRAEAMHQFLAVMGMGLEGANLDHAPRFAGLFRAVGDEEGAALQERVADEEVPHCALGLRWFARLTGASEGELFERWERSLPPPLSPLLMRGAPPGLERRERAGFPPAFLEALQRWEPQPR